MRFNSCRALVGIALALGIGLAQAATVRESPLSETTGSTEAAARQIDTRDAAPNESVSVAPWRATTALVVAGLALMATLARRRKI